MTPMILQDLQIITLWWLLLGFLGISIFPLVATIFHNFTDKGYIFSKILSIAVLSYIAFLLGVAHIAPFTLATLIVVLITMFLLSYWIRRKAIRALATRRLILQYLFEELLFLVIMAFWVLVRGFNPEVHGLEKYMDFGFMNSILRTEYFPAKDMWMTPYTINYYYFGHLYSAVLIKVSNIPSFIAYNLILGTVAGLCFTSSFSIVITLLAPLTTIANKGKLLLSGLIAGILVTFSGNLHTLYTLFKPYENETPVPPWKLTFSPETFPNSYWYPNATRFIYNTIHEFPIYSWVVADLHGHVLDIPFVLLTIACLYAYLSQSLGKGAIKSEQKYLKALAKLSITSIDIKFLALLSFLLAVMYMTNAWDGLIYLLLTGLIIIFITIRHQILSLKNTSFSFLSIFNKVSIASITVKSFFVFVGFVLFSLPFSIHFKPFVSGIGILCAPGFLTELEKIGPFLFEANHCQHSPWWQIIILYGFFFFMIISFLLFLRNRKRTTSDIFIILLSCLSLILIIIPEFLYAKDIYPAHYRANTMFKLVFQSFIMLSLVSAYTIIRIGSSLKSELKTKSAKIATACFIACTTVFVAGISIYPYFAVTSYYNNLTTYQGLNGITYLKKSYPTDYNAIMWLQNNVTGQPVILEAQGDSYTDFARVSSNTGLPTIVGWPVHEWLWRGEYDYKADDPKRTTDTTPYYPAPRIGDVQKLYESSDIHQTKILIAKYQLEYIFIGDLERQKYPNLYEPKWEELGGIVYESGQTRIYKL